MTEIECRNCKIIFKVKNNRALKANYCSRLCRSQYIRNKIIIVGLKFNKLTIINEIESDGQIRMVKCLCDCGELIKIRLTSVRTGYAKSCGCIEKIGRNDSVTSIALSRHPLHRVWSNMVQRCTNKKHKNYRLYGGKGVKICEEWRNNYKSFLNWALTNGWEKGLELDKDILGDGLLYSPTTSKFITSDENRANRSISKRLIFNEKEISLTEFCKINNIKWHKAAYYFDKGFLSDEILKKCL